MEAAPSTPKNFHLSFLPLSSNFINLLLGISAEDLCQSRWAQEQECFAEKGRDCRVKFVL